MSRTYHTDPGYVTVAEANRIVLRILKIVDQDDKSHYRKLLSDAKKGLYGGKKYGKTIYQVRKKDIIKYAEKCMQEEQLKLFNITLANDLKIVDESIKLPFIDKQIEDNLKFYLSYLKHYQIISEEVIQTAERNLAMRLKMQSIAIR